MTSTTVPADIWRKWVRQNHAQRQDNMAAVARVNAEAQRVTQQSVLHKEVLAVLIEPIVWHVSRLRLDQIVQDYDRQAVDTAKVGVVGDEGSAASAQSCCVVE